MTDTTTTAAPAQRWVRIPLDRWERVDRLARNLYFSKHFDPETMMLQPGDLDLVAPEPAELSEAEREALVSTISKRLKQGGWGISFSARDIADDVIREMVEQGWHITRRAAE